MAYMELEGIPLSSFNPNEEGWSWIRLDSNRVAIMCLELLGVTKVCLYMCTCTYSTCTLSTQSILNENSTIGTPCYIL